ncbi:MAG: hypothetical protein ACJAT2_003643 [Bacteriovoracaceae bacterium]
MEKLDLNIENLIRYYSKYKELITLHQLMGFGDSPRSSEGFTEGLCSAIYSLKKDYPDRREWDLIGKDGKRYEVKGTVGKNNSTSINPENRFDILIWVNINIDNDELIFRHYHLELIQDFLKFKKYKSAKPTISLNLIPQEKSLIERYLINIGEKSITKKEDIK